MRTTMRSLPLVSDGRSVASAPTGKAKRRSLRVALVSMPFVSATRPSIQLGLLRSIARRHGFDAKTFHLCLDFAKLIGPSTYQFLSEHRGRMLGDWLFSLEAFGAQAPDPNDSFIEAFPDHVTMLREAGDIEEATLRALRRQKVPAFLDMMTTAVPWSEFDVVGFTCTFQQTVASAALARRIRAVNPHARFVFGGANLDGDMGLEVVRAIETIDYGVTGEADVTFPALLAALDEGRDPYGIPGVIVRDGNEVRPAEPARPFEDMDSQPVPDYDEYFQRAEALDLLPEGARGAVMLPFESSRGCWWGAKKHCTFCGLNGSTMKYRAKKPARVEAELAMMAKRYQSFTFQAVDNIMEHTYLKTLLPSLIEKETGYTFFYEIKSNVGREDLRLMRQAGIFKIQPGVESLSTPVLRLMRKGVTAIQNVNMLRWSRYYGLKVAWNILHGFPGETHENHQAQAALFGLISHLEPPDSVGPIWLERFSPLFREKDSFPADFIRAEPSYRHVYPESTDLDKLAYFFDYRLQGCLETSPHEYLTQAVASWQKRWKAEVSPTMTYHYAPGYMQIEDRRDPEAPRMHSLEGPLSALYLALSDRPRKIEALRESKGFTWPAEDIKRSLDELCGLGLVMEDEGVYLALALPGQREGGGRR